MAHRHRPGRVAGIAGVIAVALALPSAAPATWQEPVPGAQQVSDIGASPSLAAVGSVPYVAFLEFHGPSDLLFVARLNASGSGWQKVGGPVNHDTTHNAYDPSLASVGGVPYVAWNEKDGTAMEIHVARLNAAGHWEEPWKGVDATHGGINFDPSMYASTTSLADVGGVPYVGWDEFTSGNVLVPRVARLDTSTHPAPTWVEPWTGVSATSGGLQKLTSQPGYAPRVASINNTPYAGWVMGGTANEQVHVARLEGSAWVEPWTGVTETLGGINSNQAGGLPSLASIGGYPYVAWADEGGNLDARVARLDTSTFPAPTWTQEAIGVSGSDGKINQDPTQNVGSLSLAEVDAGPFGTGVPYLAWSEHVGPASPDGYTIRVARYNKVTRVWEQPWPGVTPTFGGIGESAGADQRDPTLVTVGGVPWVSRAFSGAGATGIRISRLEPDFTTESAAPAPGGGEQLSVNARTYGIPYPIGFQYGPALEADTTPVAAPAGSDTATITKNVGTLRPNTTYEYRAFAIAGTPAPPAFGATLTVRTNGSGTGTSSGSGTGGTGSGTNAVALATVLRESLSPASFRAAPSGPSARSAKRQSYGTVVTHNLDRAGRVTFSVTQRQAGRRGAHGRCVKPTARNRKARRCTRTVTLRGSFAQAGKAGVNKFRFTGRLARRALKPGRYRLNATPTSGRLKGRTVGVAFRVVK